jgi:hypothetical protein
VLLLFPPAAFATTYYIDFVNGSNSNGGISKATPWKLAPGMNGFAGAYAHSAGDVFIFKGGVTWPRSAMPLTISSSGSSGGIDSYTTDHTWFAGGSWSQPVFDGGSGGGTPALIFCSGRGFFALNDLRLTHVGTFGVGGSYYTTEFLNCHNLTISNFVVNPDAWIGLYVVGTSGTTLNNITIDHNDISNVGMGIIVATAGANTIFNNVLIHDNTLHDFASQLNNGVHGDGIHVWGAGGDSSQYVQNGKIYNNRFYGSFFGTAGMTAFMFVEQIRRPIQIFNNVGSYTDVLTANQFESLITLSSDGSNPNASGSLIANNTLRGTTPGMSAGILLRGIGGVTLRNNIVAGMKYCLDAEDPTAAAGSTTDYNDLFCTDGSSPAGYWGTRFYSFAGWQGIGNDTHGRNTDPLFVLAPGDLHLRAASPNYGVGTNLFGLFGGLLDRDAEDNPRPSVGAWTIGAYQGLGLGPASPSNLRILSLR